MAYPNDYERLIHIAEAIDWIAQFIEPMDFDGFRLDHKTRLSIERLLEIIGEAANHINPVLKDSYPDIPWRQITDMRNVVSHEYFQIRLEIIWEVATIEIPLLGNRIQKILVDLDHDSADS